MDPDFQDLYGRREKSFLFDDVFKEKDDNKVIFEKIVQILC